MRSWWVRPTSSINSLTLWSRVRSLRCRPKPILSLTLRWGNRAPSCGRYPTPLFSGAIYRVREACCLVSLCRGSSRERLATSMTQLPSISTRPEFGVSKPAMILSNVVLPLPDEPTTETNWPGAISRSNPSNILRSPKNLEIPITRTDFPGDLLVSGKVLSEGTFSHLSKTAHE